MNQNDFHTDYADELAGLAPGSVTADPNITIASETPNGCSLQRLVGPCADAEQRIKDLYIVNNVAGWAQNNLRLLAESE